MDEEQWQPWHDSIRRYEGGDSVPVPSIEEHIADVIGNMPEIAWCLHCQRTYRRGEFRLERVGSFTFVLCPYEGCTGDVPLDGHSYHDRRTGRDLCPEHPEWPETPVPGVVYRELADSPEGE